MTTESYKMSFDAREWRFGRLMDTADLNLVRLDHFRLICRVLRKADFSVVVDGRKFLIQAISSVIVEHNLFREAIADKMFVSESFASAQQFFRTLEIEGYLLDEVAEVVAKLDATAGIALVIQAEHVSKASDDDFDSDTYEAFSRIQSLRHLYKSENPSRTHPGR